MKNTNATQFRSIAFMLLVLILIMLTSCKSGGQSVGVQGIKLVNSLPVALHETSGLACDTLPGNISVLRSHNDKGAAPIIYTLNPATAEIIQSMFIMGIENKDWEDLAQNDTMLFIGDTGNNKGKRSNFTIYALPKRQLLESKDTILFDGYEINYVYQNQQEVAKGEAHNYDAEAIVYDQGFLYVFSKNRKDDSTVIYKLLDKAGFQVAERVSAFKTGFLVTSATKYNGHWYVLGYQKKGKCELLKLHADLLKPSILEKWIFGDYADLGQMEAICFDANGTLYITAEAIKEQEARLYKRK
jgi:hypothetical protein